MFPLFKQLFDASRREDSRIIPEDFVSLNKTQWKTIPPLSKPSASTPKPSIICSSQRRRPVGDLDKEADSSLAELMDVIKEAGVTNGCDRAMGNLL